MTTNNSSQVRGKVKRFFYFMAGFIFLILGIIGIILPILPTTPFLLLAAASFTRSSEKAYNWLLNSRILGRYIRNYREGKGIPLRAKIFAVSLLWIFILASALIFVSILWIQILLIIIAISVSIHISLIKPKNIHLLHSILQHFMCYVRRFWPIKIKSQRNSSGVS